MKNFSKKLAYVALLLFILALTVSLSACDFLFAQLTSISAEYSGGDIVVGGTLDKTKISVGAVYSNRNSKIVTGWTASEIDTSTVGVKTVTVTYTENGISAESSFDVKVVPVSLDSITVQYTGGNVFLGGKLPKGSVSVTANYNNGTSRSVESWTATELDSSAIGTTTVTVSYTEYDVTKTDSFEVEIVKAKLVSISATYAERYVDMSEGVDRNKLTVTATYEDNSTKNVTAYTLSDLDSATTGGQTVTVTYTEDGVTATATFSVEVQSLKLSRIEAIYNGELYEGDSLDRTKLTVTAYFENDLSETVTSYTLSADTFNEAGEQTVTVSYTVGSVTKTTTFTVNVQQLVLERIEAVYHGKSITIGAQPKKSDFTVTAHYNSGKQITVTDFEIEFDSSEAGDKPCKILYGSTSVTINITVTDGPKEPTEGEYDVNVIKDEALSIHFLMLGNKYVGDSVYIKAGETDILIDAGSRYDSASTIEKYVDQYCTDGKLEYVVATHAHQDHIEGFVTGSGNGGGILDRFKVDTIITYALKKTTSKISGYFTDKLNALKKQGVNVYDANECVSNANNAQKEYTLADGITMEILDQKYYHQKTSNENDYSVCLMIKQGENNYLFTGDLEADGEASLAQLNPDLPKVKLWKGGHHGSYTAGNTALIQKIQPETVCICTCMGTAEYTTGENTYPAQGFVDRVAQYTDRVYCTSDGTKFSSSSACIPANGNIVFACTNGQITMYFSNNNLKLKDTDWFKQNRTMPNAWKN